MHNLYDISERSDLMACEEHASQKVKDTMTWVEYDTLAEAQAGCHFCQKQKKTEEPTLPAVARVGISAESVLGTPMAPPRQSDQVREMALQIALGLAGQSLNRPGGLSTRTTEVIEAAERIETWLTRQ